MLSTPEVLDTNIFNELGAIIEGTREVEGLERIPGPNYDNGADILRWSPITGVTVDLWVYDPNVSPDLKFDISSDCFAFKVGFNDGSQIIYEKLSLEAYRPSGSIDFGSYEGRAFALSRGSLDLATIGWISELLSSDQEK